MYPKFIKLVKGKNDHQYHIALLPSSNRLQVVIAGNYR